MRGGRIYKYLIGNTVTSNQYRLLTFFPFAFPFVLWHLHVLRCGAQHSLAAFATKNALRLNRYSPFPSSLHSYGNRGIIRWPKNVLTFSLKLQDIVLTENPFKEKKIGGAFNPHSKCFFSSAPYSHTVSIRRVTGKVDEYWDDGRVMYASEAVCWVRINCVVCKIWGGISN